MPSCSLGYALSPFTFGFGTITLDLYRDLPPAEASDAIYADILQYRVFPDDLFIASESTLWRLKQAMEGTRE